MEMKPVIFFFYIILHFYSLLVGLYENSNASPCWYLEVGFEVLIGIGVKVTCLIVGMTFETKSCKLTLQETGITVKSVHNLQGNYIQNRNCGNFSWEMCLMTFSVLLRESK